MNGNTVMILLVAVLIVTMGGVVVLYEVTQGYQQSGQAQKEATNEQLQNDLVVTNIIGTNTVDDGIKYVQIQVRYDGEGELNLNDTFIQLRTDKSITDLQYRNGTTNRSVADGFYTQ